MRRHRYCVAHTLTGRYANQETWTLKYALVDNVRTEAFPNGRGICPSCYRETQSKCGLKNAHHWAHLPNQNCGAFWENETQWHRDWKSYWDDKYQEIVQRDSLTNEKHIADVLVPIDSFDSGSECNNLAIEFQNSPMSEVELISRESFYKNMIWVVNGESFKSNFRLGAKLPNPLQKRTHDFCIQSKPFDENYFMYFRHSDKKLDSKLVEYFSSLDMHDFIESNYAGHHNFEWSRPRYIWFKATKPVYLDFGEGWLARLARFNPNSCHCVQLVSKRNFIEALGGKFA
ncbi:hypothetical protein GWA11_22195 [Vibrio parahaemolyticus]|nr:hypothetical protein [Vibrio parahaemolyticus]